MEKIELTKLQNKLTKKGINAHIWQSAYYGRIEEQEGKDILEQKSNKIDSGLTDNYEQLEEQPFTNINDNVENSAEDCTDTSDSDSNEIINSDDNTEEDNQMVLIDRISIENVLEAETVAVMAKCCTELPRFYDLTIEEQIKLLEIIERTNEGKLEIEQSEDFWVCGIPKMSAKVKRGKQDNVEYKDNGIYRVNGAIIERARQKLMRMQFGQRLVDVVTWRRELGWKGLAEIEQGAVDVIGNSLQLNYCTCNMVGMSFETWCVKEWFSEDPSIKLEWKNVHCLLHYDIPAKEKYQLKEMIAMNDTGEHSQISSILPATQEQLSKISKIKSQCVIQNIAMRQLRGVPDGMLLVNTWAKTVSPFIGQAYVAISHTWGKWKDSMVFSTIQPANRVPRLKSGTAFPTEHDMVQVAAKLGFEYVWLDWLCLDQDDKTNQLDDMQRQANIYANAKAVIVVIRGDEALTAMKTLVSMSEQEVYDGESLPKDPDLVINTAAKVPWFTSMWTVQEMQLSTTLIFVLPDGQIIIDEFKIINMLRLSIKRLINDNVNKGMSEIKALGAVVVKYGSIIYKFAVDRSLPEYWETRKDAEKYNIPIPPMQAMGHILDPVRKYGYEWTLLGDQTGIGQAYTAITGDVTLLAAYSGVQHAATSCMWQASGEYKHVVPMYDVPKEIFIYSGSLAFVYDPMIIYFNGMMDARMKYELEENRQERGVILGYVGIKVTDNLNDEYGIVAVIAMITQTDESGDIYHCYEMRNIELEKLRQLPAKRQVGLSIAIGFHVE